MYVDITAAHGIYPTTGSYYNDKPNRFHQKKIKDYFLTHYCFSVLSILNLFFKTVVCSSTDDQRPYQGYVKLILEIDARCLFWYHFPASSQGRVISSNQLLGYSVCFTTSNKHYKITKQEGRKAAENNIFESYS